MFQSVAHYGIHYIVPVLVAYFCFRSKWKLASLIMISTMLVDLDHLLATPIFDPNRCSINFHPLHSYYAVAVYVFLLIPKKTRLVALGLCIHMLADQVDCLFM